MLDILRGSDLTNLVKRGFVLFSVLLLLVVIPPPNNAYASTTLILNPGDIYRPTVSEEWADSKEVCESEPLNGTFDYRRNPKPGSQDPDNGIQNVRCVLDDGSIPENFILIVDNMSLIISDNFENYGTMIVGNGDGRHKVTVSQHELVRNYGTIELHRASWETGSVPNLTGLGTITSAIPGLGSFVKLLIEHEIAERALNTDAVFSNEFGAEFIMASDSRFFNVGDFENKGGTLRIAHDALFKNGIDHELPIVDVFGKPLYSEFSNTGTVINHGSFVNTDFASNRHIIENYGIIINQDAHYDDVADRRLPERTVTNIDGDGFINYGEIRNRNGGQIVNLPPAGSLIGDMISASFEPAITLATLGAGTAVKNMAQSTVTQIVSKVALKVGLEAVDIAGNVQTVVSEVVEVATLDEEPQGDNTDGILCDFIEQELVGLSYIENKGLIRNFDGGSILNYCWALINNDEDGEIRNDGVFYNRGGMARTGDFINTGQFHNRNHDQDIAAGGASWHWGGLILNSDHFQNKGHVENSGYFLSGDPFINADSECGQYHPYLDYHKTVTECDHKMINGPGIVSNWDGALFANLYYMGNKDSEIIISCDSTFINGPVKMEGTGTIKSAGTIENLGEMPPVQNISGKCIDENSITITDIDIGNNGDEEGDDIEFVASFTDTSTNDNWKVKFDFDDGKTGTASKDSKDKIEEQCGEIFVGFEEIGIDPATGLPILVPKFEPIFCFSHWKAKYSDDHRYGDDDDYKVKASVTHTNPSKIIASDGIVIYSATGSDSRTETFDIENDNPVIRIDTIRCKDVYHPDVCPPLDDVKPSNRYLTPVNENELVTITGGISDNGWLDTFEDATIDWGDGMGIQNLALNDDYDSDGSGSDRSATQTFTATHKYGDNGEYSIQVCVDDDDGGDDCDTEIITVNNVHPTIIEINAIPNPQDENSPIDFTGIITDPGSDDIFISWDWSDTLSDSETYLLDDPNTDPFPSPSVNPRNIEDTQTHTWGDNGIFNIDVCVWDDDMIIDGVQICEIISVTINNVSPTAEINTSELRLIQDIPTFLGKVSEPVDFSANSQDPGSDDLQFTWFWDDNTSDTVTMYQVNPPNNDPLSSPSIQPRDVIDNTSHTYAETCLYDIELTLDEDDGAIASDTGNVVIVGNQERTKPPGYWQTQASGLLSGKGKIDFTEYQFQCLLDIATHMSSFYGEQSSLSSIEESKDILAISKKATERDLFDKDLLTAWLNYGIGATDLDRPVDTDNDKVDDNTFSEIMDVAEAVRLDSTSTDAEIREQRLNINIFYTSER